jgi:hypothetical protein
MPVDNFVHKYVQVHHADRAKFVKPVYPHSVSYYLPFKIKYLRIFLVNKVEAYVKISPVMNGHNFVHKSGTAAAPRAFNNSCQGSPEFNPARLSGAGPG